MKRNGDLMRYRGEQNLSPQSQSCNKFGLFPCQATSATCISTDPACSKKVSVQNSLFVCCVVRVWSSAFKRFDLKHVIACH